jgi:hypothetical protein
MFLSARTVGFEDHGKSATVTISWAQSLIAVAFRIDAIVRALTQLDGFYGFVLSRGK